MRLTERLFIRVLNGVSHPAQVRFLPVGQSRATATNLVVAQSSRVQDSSMRRTHTVLHVINRPEVTPSSQPFGWLGVEN
jgi:hypothetical protein